MYTDGQLNPQYQALISQDTDIVMLMRQLDAMGIDIQKLIIDLIAYLSEQPVVDEPTSEPTDEPLVEQGYGQGEGNVQEAPVRRAARLVKAMDKSANPVVNYELRLREWLGDYLRK